MSVQTRTALLYAAGVKDDVLYLDDASAVVKGSGILVDREVCQALAAGNADGSVRVSRGVSGWQTVHGEEAVVTIGALSTFSVTRDGVFFNPLSGLVPQASWVDSFGTTPSLAVSLSVLDTDQDVSATFPIGTV